MIKALTKIIGDKDAAKILTSFILVLTIISMMVYVGNVLFN